MTAANTHPTEFDHIWEGWKDKHGFEEDIKRHKENRKRFHEKMGEYLAGASKVLEVGCGTAIDTNILARENPKVKFFGMDNSRNGIAVAKKVSREFGNNIILTQGDANDLFYKKESFDLVFSQGVMEHFNNPGQSMREQVEILKEGGILVINVPQKYTGYTLMKHRQMKNDSWEWVWETEYSCSGLKKLGLPYGLEVIDVFGYQYWRSWEEPAFVLRDSYGKFHRRNPLRNYKGFMLLKDWHDELWDFLEKRWGHYFMQNIVMVFRK